MPHFPAFGHISPVANRGSCHLLEAGRVLPSVHMHLLPQAQVHRGAPHAPARAQLGFWGRERPAIRRLLGGPGPGLSLHRVWVTQLGSSRHRPPSHHYPPPGQPPGATPRKPGVLPKARSPSPPHVTIPEGFPGETLHSSTFYHFTSLKGEKHDNKTALSPNTVIFSKAGTGTGFYKT